MNRLKIDAGSLAKIIDATEEQPITSVPDEERPKMFAALKLTGTYGILELIRGELVRLVQERVQPAAEKDWGYLSRWDPSVPEGILDEKSYIAQMRQRTLELIEAIAILETTLPQQQDTQISTAADRVHALLNTLRGILFQFVRSLENQNPDDQLITYVKMNSDFATLLGAPEENADE